MKSTSLLYVAKDPGPGVIQDLQSFSDHDITVCACNPGYVDYYKLIGYNVITSSQLSAGVDMKFDVIIGNPPYSDRSNCHAGGGGIGPNLDSAFFLKCMELSDHVSLIIRAKHFMSTSSAFRRTLFTSGCVSIKYIPPETFPSILNTQTCIVEWSANHKGKTQIVYKSGDVVDRQLSPDDVIKLDNPNFVDRVENNLSHRFISGTLTRNKIIDTPNGLPMVEICGTGDKPVVRYIQEGLEECGRNCHGVIMNYSTDWGKLCKLFIKPYDHSVSNSIVLLKTDTQEQAEQLLNYLQSDKIKDLVKMNMSSFHPTKSLFNKIPDPLLTSNIL